MSNCYPMFNKDRIVYEYHGNLRIGADDDDIVEIKNYVVIWQELIELLNGKNEIETICDYFDSRYKISREKTKKFINQFYERNLVELLSREYENNPKTEYFQSVLTYYSSRGLGGTNLLERLQNLHVTVLGCGGGGSQLAFQLAQLGVGNIHIVDNDVVALNNINRQTLFDVGDLGKPKVEMTKRAILKKNPYVNITVSNKKLRNIEDVKREIKRADWVFCAMDEPPYLAQRITNVACIQLGIPCLYCFSQKSAGKLFMVNPQKTGCVDCLLKSCDSSEYREFLVKFKDNTKELITANIYCNISLLCAWVIKKWLDVYSEKTKDVWNKLYRYSFDTFREDVIWEYEKNNSCPICGIEDSSKEGKDSLWEILKIE